MVAAIFPSRSTDTPVGRRRTIPAIPDISFYPSSVRLSQIPPVSGQVGADTFMPSDICRSLQAWHPQPAWFERRLSSTLSPSHQTICTIWCDRDSLHVEQNVWYVRNSGGEAVRR